MELQARYHGARYGSIHVNSDIVLYKKQNLSHRGEAS